MRRSLSATTLVAIAILLIGCGGGTQSGTVQPGASGNAILTIGDAPSDRILSFEITITSIVLMNPSGANVTVVSAPTNVELSHLAETFSPITRVNVPQGTYTAATVTFAHPEVTFLDANNTKVEREVPLTNSTATVNLNPSLVVGSNALSVNFDLNVGQSVAFDAAGTPSVSPVIAISNSVVAVASNDSPENGEVEDIRGTIQSVAANSFTLAIDEGSQVLTFNTNASTMFEGVTALSALSSGMAVEVSGATQNDGSLIATKVDVEVETSGDAELAGLISAVSGSPASSFQMVVHESESMSALRPAIGSTTTIAIDSRTRFRMNPGRINLGGLPSQTNFDASSLSVGQEVEASTDAPGPSSEQGHTITLRQQSLSGVVSGVATSGSGTLFTLTLASDSAFSVMTGKSSLTVFAPNGSLAVSNGTTIRVRGLLFSNAGAYDMVAGRISNP